MCTWVEIWLLTQVTVLLQSLPDILSRKPTTRLQWFHCSSNDKPVLKLSGGPAQGGRAPPDLKLIVNCVDESASLSPPARRDLWSTKSLEVRHYICVIKRQGYRIPGGYGGRGNTIGDD